MNAALAIEDVGTMHYVYLGAPHGGQIDSAYEKAAQAECSAVFASFTVSRATGMFRGKREDTLIFHIATSNTGEVLELANRMRERFDQDGVGVVRPATQGDLYSRVIKATST